MQFYSKSGRPEVVCNKAILKKSQISKESTCFGFFLFFFLSGFSFTDTDNSQDSRGREGTILFHSTTSTRSRTFRHLFATLHVRWLSHIFNRTACIYQAATRWDLPPYRITIWLIDDVMLVFDCLLANLLVGFVAAISLEKPVDSNSQRLSSLYLQANRLTKCASHCFRSRC